MADVSFKHIKQNASREEISEYLGYLVDRLEYILENIDEENLTEELKNKIGGINGYKRTYR